MSLYCTWIVYCVHHHLLDRMSKRLNVCKCWEPKKGKPKVEDIYGALLFGQPYHHNCHHFHVLYWANIGYPRYIFVRSTGEAFMIIDNVILVRLPLDVSRQTPAQQSIIIINFILNVLSPNTIVGIPCYEADSGAPSDFVAVTKSLLSASNCWKVNDPPYFQMREKWDFWHRCRGWGGEVNLSVHHHHNSLWSHDFEYWVDLTTNGTITADYE